VKAVRITYTSNWAQPSDPGYIKNVYGLGEVRFTANPISSAYSGGCRTPIPIHIGQSFQFKADTCSD